MQFKADLSPGHPSKGLIRSSLGNFGHYDAGTVFQGRVHYPISNQDGCKPFRASDLDNNHLKEASLDGHKTIIMVDRGNCHFVTKVLNIQRFGGIVAIVVDSDQQEQTRMADDGSGSAVRIPSFLIGKEDGKVIKAAIH